MGPGIKDVSCLHQAVANGAPQRVVSVEHAPAGLEGRVQEAVARTAVPESTELAVEATSDLLRPVDHHLLLQLLLRLLVQELAVHLLLHAPWQVPYLGGAGASAIEEQP